MKLGAIAVPLFTLFGPDGVRLRVDDCKPQPAGDQRREGAAARIGTARASSSPMTRSSTSSSAFRRTSPPTRAADALAIFQYTSGTTRELPEAVKHTPSRDRHADGGGAVRHRPAAGRSLHLPVLARLGPRPVARHAGAAGARHHHRRLCRQVRRRAADEGAAGAPASPTCRRPPPTTA